tara:strand:+ start:454 stop:654 length:201 start_codon:yes stop_codon:yes gene_type:complete
MNQSSFGSKRLSCSRNLLQLNLFVVVFLALMDMTMAIFISIGRLYVDVQLDCCFFVPELLNSFMHK